MDSREIAKLNISENLLDDVPLKLFHDKTLHLIQGCIDVGVPIVREISINCLNRSSEFAPPKKTWAWNSSKRGSKVVLKDNNCLVERLEGDTDSVQAVIGSVPMKTGIYKWKIEMSSGQLMKSGVCCGIVRSDLATNLDNFDIEKALTITSYGWIYQMKKLNELAHYDRKILDFYLDFNQGVFSVSSNGKTICERKDSIKGASFYPCCALVYTTSYVKLLES